MTGEVRKKTWTSTEINNDSGHYRPSSETLTYVKYVLDQNYKINVSKAKLVNTLNKDAQLRYVDILGDYYGRKIMLLYADIFQQETYIEDLIKV